MAQIAATGDAVALFQTLLSATWYGIVSDKDTPMGMAATLEMVGDEAVITTDVLVGRPGADGKPAPIVKMQWPQLQQPAELPTNLQDTEADRGKAWWIGTLVYVWTGTTFEAVRPGPTGPPGATPIITPTVRVIPMSERTPESESTVVVTGTTGAPQWHLELLAPQGPPGDNATINQATDVQGVPTDGQTLVWNEAAQKWKPSDYTAKHPRHYSVPEGMFTPFTGIAQRQTIMQYQVPPQDFAWTPYITGHLKAAGVETDADPFTIGCEVRLGDPTSGALVARGFGNIANWTNISPHFSSTADPAAAVAPDNGVATVPAGQAAQISVNLYNDGILGGVYLFNNAGAQLSILVMPQG